MIREMEFKCNYADVSIGTFIKRIRTQKKYSLERVSEGIIAVSYLSKIENNIQSGSKEIINAVLKRLGIKYEEYYLQKNISPYQVVLLNYLKKNYGEQSRYTEMVLKSNVFSEIEKSLILTFDALISGIYDQVQKELLQYQEQYKLYTEEELFFISYMFTLYAHKSNRSILAFNLLKELSKFRNVSMIETTCICILSSDIYFSLGAITNYLVNFNFRVKQLDKKLTPDRFLINDVRMLYIKNRKNVRELKKAIIEYRGLIDKRYKDHIDSLVLKASYVSKDREVFLECLNEGKITGLKVMLAVATISDFKEDDYKELIINFIKDYRFKPNEKVYELITNGLICYLIDHNLKESYEILKEAVNIMFTDHYSNFLYDIAYEFFDQLSKSLSKYKDVAIVCHKRYELLKYLGERI